LTLSPTPIPVRVAADTDTGQTRQHNEDAFLIASELGLFAVADGVGGHEGGVEASRLVVTELPEFFKAQITSKDSDEHTDDAALTNASTNNSTILNESLTDTDFQRRLYRAIREVNTCVFKAGGQRATETRMGATLTGALFLSSGSTLIFNVGDSRTYCYRDKTLSCITKDQSWYQSWLDNGSVGAPPPKSIILQGVGLDETVVPDWSVKPWQANDLWLMCSDGLSDRVDEDEISRMIEAHFENDTSLVTLCGELIAAANAAGGEDNITVLALRPNSTIS